MFSDNVDKQVNDKENKTLNNNVTKHVNTRLTKCLANLSTRMFKASRLTTMFSTHAVKHVKVKQRTYVNKHSNEKVGNRG